MPKKKLQGLAEWGDVRADIEIHRCPNKKCGGILEKVSVLGFYMSVCKACKKFWSLKIVDVTKELTPKFRRENMP